MHNQSIAVLLTLKGGGTSRHATEMACAWSRQNYNVIFVEVLNRIINVKIYCDGHVQNDYKLLVENDLRALQLLLVSYHTVLLHVHHLIDSSFELLKIHRVLNIPLVITLHDYYMLCPYITLTNENDVYCEEPGEEYCNECLRKRTYRSSPFQNRIIDIQKWRNGWLRYLRQASLIVAPSEDVKKRFEKYFNELEIKVVENPEVAEVHICENKSIMTVENDQSNIRVGLLGILSKPKGADVLYNCALDAEKRRLPIKFILFGDFVEDKVKRHQDNIDVLGRYKEKEIYSLAQQNDIDFFWFPSVWPETYSYTLTIPIRLKIPVVGSDLGAIGQRIIEHGWGIIYQWDLNSSSINDLLLEFDYKKYKHMLCSFKIANCIFPNINSYYGNILKNNGNDPIDENEIIELNRIEKNALKHTRLNKLNGYELRELLIRSDSQVDRIKLMSKLDISWLVNYLQLHSAKYIAKKVIELWK